MLRAIARNALDLYTFPARAAYRQTRRNLDRIQQLYGEVQRVRNDNRAAAEQARQELGRRLGIDLSAMTREQRRHKAQAALANVEHGLSLAISEGLKALVLLTADDQEKNAKRPTDGIVIEGECEPADSQKGPAH